MTLLFPFFDDTTRFISPGHTAASPKMSERTLNFWCFGGYACWRYWPFGMEFCFYGECNGLAWLTTLTTLLLLLLDRKGIVLEFDMSF
jgi:hypothetical protein